MPTRITLLTYGTRGDVEPYLALAAGLNQRGFQARLAGPARFDELAGQYGVEFTPLAGSPEQLSRDLVTQAGGHWWRILPVMTRFILPLARSVFQAADEACRGADLILHSFLMTATGQLIAHLRGVPQISAQIFPVFCPTAHFPSPGMTPQRSSSAVLNRMTHWLTNQVYFSGGRLLYAMAPRGQNDLPRPGRWMDDPGYGRKVPILFAYSPSVLPKPPDWGPLAHVTGYWPLDPPPHEDCSPGFTPPPDLERFIDSGPPPVYIGFGSMIPGNPARLTRTVLQAVAASGQRAVLAAGWGALEHTNLPQNVFALQSIAHTWLLPRLAGAVHHGGAGTTGACLRAGIPQVIVPFTADQPFWAQRMHALGVAPAPIPLTHLNSEKLAKAIPLITTSPDLRSKAAALGGQVRAEDGIANAAQILHSLVAQ
jgi:sterol 3beta-glucosyltransferase